MAHRIPVLSWTHCVCLLPWLLASALPSVSSAGSDTFQSLPRASIRMDGWLGDRLRASTEGWLLPAPVANPGMLEMFHTRDLEPKPDLVPWAGEFAGKYLVSAILTLRLHPNPALEERIQSTVAALQAGQAEDGYLGPFPKAERLLGHWDLWGHYHAFLGLLLWHEQTGDDSALQTCRRAADLVCATYLDQDRRVLDAGSPEMNMAIAHGLGQLHRRTGEPRYWRMMQEIARDWEKAGDYHRSGLAGLEFFQTPRPRWESLHDLQALVEFHRISGDATYREAFLQHWRSIARWDVHNTGGFSTAEQAVGNPYALGAIETCCVVAWMAMSVDMLRMTGDPVVADALERSTYNAALGAQHPSGRWWTYDTPMNGQRLASAHSIVFQARAGTPELNCCSVNGPRTLGLLGEWTLMAARDGLVLNHYGPAAYEVSLPNREKVRLRVRSDYPRDGRVEMTVEQAPVTPFTLHLRIPAWSRNTDLRLRDRPLPGVVPGQYLSLNRAWRAGDQLSLALDLSVQAVSGDLECRGQASLYRGPILLAYDQRWNRANPDHLAALDIARLHGQSLAVTGPEEGASISAPYLRMNVPGPDGGNWVLVDFASAGAMGTRYRSWLPAKHAPPPAPIPRQPREGSILAPGPTLFQWTTRPGPELDSYRLAIAETPDFSRPVLVVEDILRNRWEMTDADKMKLRPQRWYYWRVTARNAIGATAGVSPDLRFRWDPELPPAVPSPAAATGPDGLLLRADLAGDPKPQWGAWLESAGWKAVDGRPGTGTRAVALNGQDQRLVYTLDSFPEEDYTATLWLRIDAVPQHRLGQVLSAWTGAMDDPLRLVLENGKLHARIEAGSGYTTPGVDPLLGEWHHLAVVKAGPRLRLYRDGQPLGETVVPAFLYSRSTRLALGGNPKFEGPEFLPATMAGFQFYARALEADEIVRLSRP